MVFGFGFALACINSLWLSLYEQGDNAIIWYRVRILPHLYQTLSLGAPPPQPPTVTYIRSVPIEVFRTTTQLKTLTLTTGIPPITVATMAPSPAWPTIEPVPTLSVFGVELPQQLTRESQPFHFGFGAYSTNNPLHILLLVLASYWLVFICFAVVRWGYEKMWAALLPKLPKTPTKRPLHTTPPTASAQPSGTPWYIAFGGVLGKAFGNMSRQFGNISRRFGIFTWQYWNFILEIRYSQLWDGVMAATWFFLDLLRFLGCLAFWVVGGTVLSICAILMILIPLTYALTVWLQKHLQPRFGRDAIQFWWEVKYRPMTLVLIGKKVERSQYDKHSPHTMLSRLVIAARVYTGAVTRQDLRDAPEYPWDYYRFNPDALRDIPPDPNDTIDSLLSHQKLHGNEVQAIKCELKQAVDDRDGSRKEVERYKRINEKTRFDLQDLERQFQSTQSKLARTERALHVQGSKFDQRERNLSQSLREETEKVANCPNCKQLMTHLGEMQTKLQVIDTQMQQVSDSLATTRQEASSSAERANKAETDLASSARSIQELQVLQTQNAKLQSTNQQLDTNIKDLRKILEEEINTKEQCLEELKAARLELAEVSVPVDSGEMKGVMTEEEHEFLRWKMQREKEKEQEKEQLSQQHQQSWQQPQFQQQQLEQQNWQQQQPQEQESCQQPQFGSFNVQPALSTMPGNWPQTPPQFQQGQGFGQQQGQEQEQQGAGNTNTSGFGSNTSGGLFGNNSNNWAVEMDHDQPNSPSISTQAPSLAERAPLATPAASPFGNPFPSLFGNTSSADKAAAFKAGKLNLPTSHTGPSLFGGRANGNGSAPSQPSGLRYGFSASGHTELNSEADPFKKPRRSMPMDNFSSMLGGNGTGHGQQLKLPTGQKPELPAFNPNSLGSFPVNDQGVKLQPLTKSSFQPPPSGLKRNGIIGFN